MVRCSAKCPVTLTLNGILGNLIFPKGAGTELKEFVFVQVRAKIVIIPSVDKTECDGLLSVWARGLTAWEQHVTCSAGVANFRQNVLEVSLVVETEALTAAVAIKAKDMALMECSK